MRDSDIWAFRSVGLNLSGIGDDQHLLFKNVDIDVSHTYESYATGAGATMFMANRLHRATFRRLYVQYRQQQHEQLHRVRRLGGWLGDEP